MKKVEIKLQDILDRLAKTEAGKKYLEDAYNLHIDDTWINIIGEQYNQNYTLVYYENDNFFSITNWELDNTDKFYKFQDAHTYKSIIPAVKAFIKLAKTKRA